MSLLRTWARTLASLPEFRVLIFFTSLPSLVYYASMFSVCTAFTAVPELPAKMLLDMHGYNMILGVHARSHCGGGAHHHPNIPILHILEQLGLGIVAPGVVNEGDLLGRDPLGHQHVPNVLIDGNAPGRFRAARRTPVAEDQLPGVADLLTVVEDLEDMKRSRSSWRRE